MKEKSNPKNSSESATNRKYPAASSIIKPPVILAIQEIIGKELHAPPTNVEDPLGWARPYSRKKVKYAWKDEHLVVLNLGGIDLKDDQWKQILELPDLDLSKLETLNLFENKLKEVRLTPEMESLKRIDVENNPLEFPAEEITKQGNEAVLRFLKEIEAQGEGKLYEVKLLIVGEGGTGKTTLWNKLQDINHPVPLPESEQPVTVGISIKEGWCFNHPEEANEKFFVNLWDFGGQEIQYMTHQFFLTPRSFYILMADGRREIGNFPYWLKIINLLGYDSRQKEKTPVLVVINKKGNPSPTLPYDPQKAQKDYPNLELIRCDVDLAVLDYELKNLPQRVQDLLCTRIPHLPLKIPKRWEEVRETLKQKNDEGINHISLDDFREICSMHQIQDELQILDLSRTLHELGVILHYQDDESLSLENFVVLNPHWAVDAVYEILNHKEVENQYGRFDRKFLKKVWKVKGYTPEEQGYLLEMMSKNNFEICFPAKEQGKDIYIAPQLLPNDPPENLSWDPGSTALQYIYQYPFMPKGLVGRFIVRMNEYIKSIEDKKLLWKKGVLLTYTHFQSQQQAEALIEETTAAKTGGEIVHIKVKSKDYVARHVLLGMIREEFRKLHAEVFPNLEFYEKIPCCCKECINSQDPHFYTLESLQKYKEKGLPNIRCDKSLEEVPIQLLLDFIATNKGEYTATAHVRNLIAKGFTEAALEELKRLTPKQLQDDITLLESRFRRHEATIREGTLSEGSSEESTKRNSIDKAIISFCSKLEKRSVR
ncbi:MAG: COR domain-containing protein [Bacteroidota bacterium]